MRIKNAEFDIETAAPIVPGCITIGVDDPTLRSPPHEHLLLRFDLGGTSFALPTLGIWPVTDSERIENGFIKASTGCPVVFVPISAEVINHIWRNEDGRGSLLRTGYQCGQVVTSQTPMPGNAYGTVTHHFTGFKVEITCEESGLAFKLVGMLKRQKTWQVPPIISKLRNPSITVEMMIPWETLTFLGFIAVPGLSVSGPSGFELPDKQRDSLKLQDLLIVKALSWPVVQGFITVNPTDHRPSWLFYQEARHIVLTGLEEERFCFSDNARVRVLESGFVETGGISSSNYHFNLHAVGRRVMNKILNKKDSLSLSFMGDGLGEIVYETGTRMEPGDPLGSIRQQLKSLNFQANLTSEGLEIKGSGEIDDFDPEVIEEHRRERNSKVMPCRDFTFQMTLPWALLLIRGFTFAQKASRFR